jgi:hypothetical protein
MVSASHPVGYLYWFMEEPCEDHLAAVKCILRYIAATQYHGRQYTMRENRHSKLIGYIDVDMAVDVDTRKSTSSVTFFHGGNLITWQSAKRKVVALSSCEEECIAEVVRLLTDMIGTESGAPELLVDNQSAISLNKNPVFHDRSKHIDVRFSSEAPVNSNKLNF